MTGSRSASQLKRIKQRGKQIAETPGVVRTKSSVQLGTCSKTGEGDYFAIYPIRNLACLLQFDPFMVNLTVFGLGQSCPVSVLVLDVAASRLTPNVTETTNSVAFGPFRHIGIQL